MLSVMFYFHLYSHGQVDVPPHPHKYQDSNIHLTVSKKNVHLIIS